MRKFIPGLSQLEDLISDLVGESLSPLKMLSYPTLKRVGMPDTKLQELQTDFETKRQELERFQQLGKKEVSPFKDRETFLKSKVEEYNKQFKGATYGTLQEEYNRRKAEFTQQITSCFKPHTAE